MPRKPACPIASRSALAGLVIDHGNAARGRPARLHAEQRRRIVGAVDARRHDHHALDMQRLVQRAHLLRRGQLRRIDAPRKEREFFGVGVDVGVAVAGAGRHVEIDWLSMAGPPSQMRYWSSWQLPPQPRQAGFRVASAWFPPTYFLIGRQSNHGTCRREGRRTPRGANTRRGRGWRRRIRSALSTETTPLVIPRSTARSNVKPAPASAPADTHNSL